MHQLSTDGKFLPDIQQDCRVLEYYRRQIQRCHISHRRGGLPQPTRSNLHLRPVPMSTTVPATTSSLPHPRAYWDIQHKPLSYTTTTSKTSTAQEDRTSTTHTDQRAPQGISLQQLPPPYKPPPTSPLHAHLPNYMPSRPIQQHRLLNPLLPLPLRTQVLRRRRLPPRHQSYDPHIHPCRRHEHHRLRHPRHLPPLPTRLGRKLAH